MAENIVEPDANDRDSCIGKTFPQITPEFLDSLQKKFPGKYAEYKVLRLNEMACLWKGKKFEPYTVRLLSMLLVENGALNEDVRGDHGYAFGLTQEHICRRGLNLAYLGAGDGVKTFCGSNGPALVEKEFPHFSHDWVSQFFYFSQYISPMIDGGSDARDIVHAWNRNEVGRQAKVDKNEPFVKAALGL